MRGRARSPIPHALPSVRKTLEQFTQSIGDPARRLAFGLQFHRIGHRLHLMTPSVLPAG